MNGEAVGLEDGYPVGAAPSRLPTGCDGTELLQPLPVEAVPQKIPALEARYLGRIRHHPIGAPQGLGVQLALGGNVGTHGVDISARGKERAVEDGLGGTGRSDDDVGLARGSVGLGLFIGEAEPAAHPGREPVAAFRGAADNEDSLQVGQNLRYGFHLALGLPSDAEDGEYLAFGAGEVPRSDGTGGSGAPLAEHVGLEDRVQPSARQPVEEEGEAGALGDVRTYYGVALHAHGTERRHERPHDVEDRTFGLTALARIVRGLSAAEQAENFFDRFDGHGERQKLPDLDLDQHGSHLRECDK